ncbi:lymphocyte cytosolic protein 2 [Cricetulus griseus]
MALKNVPFRSEVLAWNPDSLADYFRKLNYRDCEKAVKKYHIDGARFLNLTENDIQKFPKLRMPATSGLLGFTPQLLAAVDSVDPRVDLGIYVTDAPRSVILEEDDYESPNDDDPEGEEDDGDYESPNEEEGALVDDVADYEPPPSNDEEALQNSILPAKPFPNTNSMYIDRPPTSKVSQQPPVPPQRPMAALPPLPTGRNSSVSLLPFFQATLYP